MKTQLQHHKRRHTARMHTSIEQTDMLARRQVCSYSQHNTRTPTQKKKIKNKTRTRKKAKTTKKQTKNKKNRQHQHNNNHKPVKHKNKQINQKIHFVKWK